MADITLDAVAKADTHRGVRALVYTTASIGYFFFIDADDDFKYVKTADGGATWGSPVTVAVGVVFGFDVWFDQWTSGDAGTVIHTWYNESGVDDIIYRALDTNGDTLGTAVTVFAGTTSAAALSCVVTGTKARGGNLYCAFCIDNGVEIGTYRSVDSGANWTVRTNLVEASTDEYYWLFPGNAADAQDVWMIYQDQTAGSLTLKVHDDSADTNAESASILTIVTNTTSDMVGQFRFSGAVRHSDGHLIIAVFTDIDTATGDLRIFDVTNSGSITELTAIETNKDDSYYPSVFIDQSTNDIYVAYIGKKDGSETLGTTASVCYSKSADDGATWETEVVYSATASDWRRTWAPHSGPRFAVAWRDISSQLLQTNFDNSVVAGAVGVTFSVDLAGEGQLTAPSFEPFFEASLGGEGQLSAPNLVASISFSASLGGEGQLNVPNLATVSTFSVSLAGEGTLTAEFDTNLSVSLRGEMEATPAPNLVMAIAFAVNMTGGGSLRADLHVDADTMGPDSLHPHVGILDDTIKINEQLNGVSTAGFTVIGAYPNLATQTEIKLDDEVIFAGRILTDRRYYVEGHARNDVTLIDKSWKLTWKKISKRYHNKSATYVILDIMTRAPGFDLTHVQAGLPMISDIGFSGAQLDQALTDVLKRIGGHWRVGYPNFLYAGIQDTFGDDPEPLTPSHPSLTNFVISKNISQIVNRLRVIGAGSSTVAPPALEHPDFWSPAYDVLVNVDRTKFYPLGSTRLYLNRLDIPMPDDPPGTPVPPIPIFNPGGGTVLIDDTEELYYTHAGVQNFLTWVGGSGATVTSQLGGNLDFTVLGLYQYFLTFTTQWGETSMWMSWGAVQLGREYSGGETVWDDETQTWIVTDQVITPHRSFRIEVADTGNPNITAVNVWRSRELFGTPTFTGDFKVGSVPGSGGVIIDGMEAPLENTDGMPDVDTSMRPPMAYIDIGSLSSPIAVGASVRILGTVNDLPSQSFLNALLDDPDDDGIIEDELNDSNITYGEIIGVGQAHLKDRSSVEITPSWDCRDNNSHPGKTQFIDMPDLQGDFKIQSVATDTFAKANHEGIGQSVNPLRHVVASSRLFTLDQLLGKLSRRRT